ncbi:DUF5818 domain-containing protein [Sphingomonas sp. CFBP8993]|uniref:DUF5818 domain-containing protein n=1 Tax=Sphingomonas sp. CFBP8993 TaxID=3096526 RepID=UPI002A69C746|nr:DUF5818 domain-containing protein [Sphingomonas sp. CFBP8993]MDY0957341.1 DUF5818 domain-containing protein [Sphingomonas sp. CFBP8993]
MTPDVSPDTLVTRSGRLIRQGGAFILQGDDGSLTELRLMRVPVDHVGKSVTVTGRMLGAGLIEVEGVRGG